MQRTITFLFCVAAFLTITDRLHAEIREIWMTFARETPTHITIGWTSDAPGASTVFFGASEDALQKQTVDGNNTLHHVEIPFPGSRGDWVYRVQTGDAVSPLHRVKGFHGDELRIAVIGNAHGNVSAQKKYDKIAADDIHLLATVGDNVSGLLGKGIDGDAAKINIVPFRQFVARYKELFASTPFMPVLGNHDRQIRSRGTKENPPTAPVYDVDATAYLAFFKLPAPGWNWKFDIPDYGLRLIGLDLNHVQDLDTFLQSSHSYKKGAEQFEWYDAVSREKGPGITVTLNNEQNNGMRNREGKAWHDMFRRGTVTLTGFGHFGERAEADGFPYFNTSVIGKGDVYKDAASKFVASRNNYILLRVPRGGETITVQLKDLDDGELLDATAWPGK